MQLDNLFNDDTLNIFTDASVYKGINGYTVSSPGAIAVLGNNIIDFANYYVPDSTNNEGEIKAIRLGIYLALKHRNKAKAINLFSDSNISIQGLKTWIYNWYRNMNDGILVSSSGKPVANQLEIINAIRDIVCNNLYINLFHQKGHVNTSNRNDLIYAINDFKSSNRGFTITYDNIIRISNYNNIVDKLTRKLFDTMQIRERDKIIAMKTTYKLDDNQIKMYRNYIGGNRR